MNQTDRDKVIEDIVSSHKFLDIIQMLFNTNRCFECGPVADHPDVFVVDVGLEEIYYFNREGELVDPLNKNKGEKMTEFQDLVSHLTEKLNKLGAQKPDDVNLGEKLGSLVVEFSQQISELPLVQEAFAYLGRVHAEQANNIIDAVQKEGGLTKDGEAVLVAGLAWLKLAKGPLE